MAGQVKVSHILLMYQGSERSTATRSKEDALSEIGIIKEKIANGEDFAELAAAHSDCPSGRDGVDLGFFTPGAMEPEFDEVAFQVEEGADSDVVPTGFGDHLLRRTG